MKKRTIFVVILAAGLTIVGCTTERYAENRREQPRTADNLSVAKKQGDVSLARNRDKYYFYYSSYSHLFPNTNTTSMMKKQDGVSLTKDRDKEYFYYSSYSLLFPNTNTHSKMKKQDGDKDYTYPSYYRCLIAN